MEQGTMSSARDFFYVSLITISCEFANHRAGSQLKMSERQTKAGKTCKLAHSHSLTLDMLKNFCFHVYAQKSLSHSLSLSLSLFLTHTLSISHSLTLDMINNFCFHVYAQKSLSHTLTLSHSHTLSISHSLTLDMLNNFCFHIYAQNSLFISENAMVIF